MNKHMNHENWRKSPKTSWVIKSDRKSILLVSLLVSLIISLLLIFLK